MEPKFHVQSVNFTAGPAGKLDTAQVLIMLEGFPADVNTPWFQVMVPGSHDPAEATLKAREPLKRFLTTALAAVDHLQRDA